MEKSGDWRKMKKTEKNFKKSVDKQVHLPYNNIC